MKMYHGYLRNNIYKIFRKNNILNEFFSLGQNRVFHPFPFF